MSMEKRLQAVGNSLGLVIDKPILRLVGLGHGSVVSLTTDGQRLIVERVDKPQARPSVDPRVALDARQVANTLIQRFGMGLAEFGQLHHERWRLFAYVGWLDCVRSEDMTEADLATMRRLETCLAERQRGIEWPEAIARALQAHPIEPSLP